MHTLSKTRTTKTIKSIWEIIIPFSGYRFNSKGMDIAKGWPGPSLKYNLLNLTSSIRPALLWSQTNNGCVCVFLSLDSGYQI